MKANHGQFLVIFISEAKTDKFINQQISKLKAKIQIKLINEFDILVEFFSNMNEAAQYLVSFVKVFLIIFKPS